MSERKIKIVTDSSSDMHALADFPFASAALRITTKNKEYADGEGLDVEGMVNDLAAYKGKSFTSCPNVSDWLEAFGDADEVYCITITARLSGSYNSACIAAKEYEEKNPGSRVFVINSRSTGGEMELVAEKLVELIGSGLSFDSICSEIMKYSHEQTGLLFMLESMRNLANNGRVSPLVAKFAGLLGIRVVGKASDEGTLETLDKCRGERRAISAVFERMKALLYRGGRVRISHCFNPEAACKLSSLIRGEFPLADIVIKACRGLCSFYAERGGMLVGFEKCTE